MTSEQMRRKGNIVVIGDTPANLRLLAGMLTKEGHKVRPMPNGELGLKTVLASPPDFEAKRVHADLRDVVNDRKNQGASAQHHLLAPEPGSHEGNLLRRTPVQPIQQVDDDRDGYPRQEDRGNDVCSGHGSILPVASGVDSDPGIIFWIDRHMVGSIVHCSRTNQLLRQVLVLDIVHYSESFTAAL